MSKSDDAKTDRVTSPPFTVSAEEFGVFEAEVASGDAKPTPSMKAAIDEHQRLARTRPQPVEVVVAELRRATDEMWQALSAVMQSLKDSGADEGCLHEATKRMRSAHDHLQNAGI